MQISTLIKIAVVAFYAMTIPSYLCDVVCILWSEAESSLDQSHGLLEN